MSNKPKKKPVAANKAYYRYQQDKQKVIKRSEEQQRIVNEYFIVKNKPKYNLILIIIGVVALLLGVILLGVGLTTREKVSDSDSSYPSYPGLGSIGLPDGFEGGQETEKQKEGPDKTALIASGAVIAVAGAVCLIVMKNTVKYLPAKVMTDEEYEALVEKRIAEMDIKQFGLDQLGIDADEIKDITPLVFKDNVFGERSLRVYNKQTKQAHSSTKYVTYIYFTDKQLLTYTIQFDMCCNEQKEESNELFYRDVCDVTSTVSKNVMEFGATRFEYCEIKFGVISSNASISVSMSGDNERLSSVQAMKQKIREIKDRQ